MSCGGGGVDCYSRSGPSSGRWDARSARSLELRCSDRQLHNQRLALRPLSLDAASHTRSPFAPTLPRITKLRTRQPLSPVASFSLLLVQSQLFEAKQRFPKKARGAALRLRSPVAGVRWTPPESKNRTGQATSAPTNQSPLSCKKFERHWLSFFNGRGCPGLLECRPAVPPRVSAGRRLRLFASGNPRKPTLS
jgi:hypothetical protein